MDISSQQQQQYRRRQRSHEKEIDRSQIAVEFSEGRDAILAHVENEHEKDEIIIDFSDNFAATERRILN